MLYTKSLNKVWTIRYIHRGWTKVCGRTCRIPPVHHSPLIVWLVLPKFFWQHLWPSSEIMGSYETKLELLNLYCLNYPKMVDIIKWKCCRLKNDWEKIYLYDLLQKIFIFRWSESLPHLQLPWKKWEFFWQARLMKWVTLPTTIFLKFERNAYTVTVQNPALTSPTNLSTRCSY